mgnify:CR=1 FL=1
MEFNTHVMQALSAQEQVRKRRNMTWQSVQEDVLGRIQNGTWPPGELIPTETELAAEFGCARATVNRALQALADSKGLEFGLKLSNTFPVDTTRGELPNNEMYMSGRSLFPLTIEMCHRISRQFKGKMRISFAGGAEYFNCDKLFAAGIWPITVATTILKPGGYNRLLQMVEKVEPMPYKPFDGTDTQAIDEPMPAPQKSRRR